MTQCQWIINGIVSLMHLLSVQALVDTLRGTRGYLPDPLLFWLCQPLDTFKSQLGVLSI